VVGQRFAFGHQTLERPGVFLLQSGAVCVAGACQSVGERLDAPGQLFRDADVPAGECLADSQGSCGGQRLGQVADAVSRDRKTHAARIGSLLPHDDAQKRGLAATIGTNEAAALAALQSEAYLIEDGGIPVRFAQP